MEPLLLTLEELELVHRVVQDAARRTAGEPVLACRPVFHPDSSDVPTH